MAVSNIRYLTILKFSGISISLSLFLYAQISSRKQSEHAWKHTSRFKRVEGISNDLKKKLKDKFPKFANNSEDHPVILVYPWYKESYDTESEAIGNWKFSAKPRHARNPEYHENSEKHTNFIYQMPESCGGCYITSESSFEKEAAAIFVENTVVGGLVKNESFNSVLPDFKNRNPDQYWISWKRESAAKGGRDLEEVTNTSSLQYIWDGQFNLTAGYRLDSDILRPFGFQELFFYRWVLQDRKMPDFDTV